MQHHAFFIEAEVEGGVSIAEKHIHEHLGLDTRANPDVVILKYGSFSPEDARKVSEAATSAPLRGDRKAIVIAATSAFHEAQNALLKIFEEPALGTHLFLVLPNSGMLLPTLRSRVAMLDSTTESDSPAIPGIAQKFLSGDREKRVALAKKLATGSDDEARRENRSEALALVNGIEAAAYAALKKGRPVMALLSDISTLRAYLYDRSAPVKMILEHLALVTPQNLGK